MEDDNTAIIEAMHTKDHAPNFIVEDGDLVGHTGHICSIAPVKRLIVPVKIPLVPAKEHIPDTIVEDDDIGEQTHHIHGIIPIKGLIVPVKGPEIDSKKESPEIIVEDDDIGEQTHHIRSIVPIKGLIVPVKGPEIDSKEQSPEIIVEDDDLGVQTRHIRSLVPSKGLIVPVKGPVIDSKKESPEIIVEDDDIGEHTHHIRSIVPIKGLIVSVKGPVIYSKEQSPEIIVEDDDLGVQTRHIRSLVPSKGLFVPAKDPVIDSKEQSPEIIVEDDDLGVQTRHIRSLVPSKSLFVPAKCPVVPAKEQPSEIIVDDGDLGGESVYIRNLVQVTGLIVPFKGPAVPAKEQPPEIIVEDGEDFAGEPPKQLIFSGKKIKSAFRNYSDVFSNRTRPVERRSSVPDVQSLLGVTETRRSLSRRGSHVQDVPRVKSEVVVSDSINGYLRSTTHKAEQTKQLELMIEKSKSTLEYHRTKVNKLKLEKHTRAIAKAYEVLKERRSVHLIGKIGLGKTHTALGVIEAFLEEHEYYKPLIIDIPIDLAVLEDTAAYVIVLADNLFGSGVMANDTCAKGWKHVMKFIVPLIERKRIYFVVTSETRVNDGLDHTHLHAVHTFLDENYEVNLENIDIALRDREQNDMLTLYSKQFCKPLFAHPKEIEEFQQSHDQTIGFPLFCNLIGIGRSTELFADPCNALYTFVSEQHEHHFPSFVLLVLVLVTENESSLAQFQQENHPTFTKLLDILKLSQCAQTELSVGLARMQRQNVLAEKESGAIVFTHELFSSAVLTYIFDNFPLVDILPLFPISVINELPFLRNSLFYSKSSGQAGQSVTNGLETSALKTIVSIISNLLDSKLAKDFMDVASSHLWMMDAFVDTVFSMLGFQFFFIEDTSKMPLSAYLVRIGNVSVISKLVSYMLTKPPRIVSMMKMAIEKTKEEACRSCEENTLLHLLKLSDTNDASVVYAAVEGGNTDMLDLIWPNTTTGISVTKDMLQTACQIGSFENMKYLFHRLDSKPDSTSRLVEMRKQNDNGETLLHYAARGGNVPTFEFLLNERCDPRVVTHDGNTVLHIAAMFGRFQMIRYICSMFPDLVRKTNQMAYTCVHMAAREGHGDVLQMLLQGDVNTTEPVRGRNTIYHIAATNGHTDIIRYMLTVSPQQQNTPNKKSFQPVQSAVINGKTETLKLFLNNGSDPMTKTVDRRSFMHLAAYYSQLDTIKYLCTTYPKLVNELDSEGNTPGHDAGASGNIHIMKYLIENGVDPLVQNNRGTTVLHEACFHGGIEMVKYLSETFPTLLGAINQNGYSVCFGAALSGNVEILKFLINNGADPNATSNEGSTILHEAAFGGKCDIVQYLCTAFPEMIEDRNCRSYMACHFAAQEGHLKCLAILLTDKSFPLPNTADNQTVLHIAAFNGMMPVVQYLCQSYPELFSCMDCDNSLAIHYAARGGHIEILQFLIDQGQHPQLCTISGSTILHLAAYDAHDNMVTYLCSKYPNLIHALDTTGHSAAHYAAGSGDLPLLLNILQYNINPLIQSENGSTLLLKAAYNGHIEMIRYLCTEHPELVTFTDVVGCNALHYAACGGYLDIIQYIIGVGLDPESATNDGHTIMHVAAFHGQLRLISNLCQEYPNLRRIKDRNGKTPEESALENGQTEVEHFLSSTKNKENSQTESSTMVVLSEICCCEGISCRPRQVLQTMINLVNCCRR